MNQQDSENTLKNLYLSAPGKPQLRSIIVGRILMIDYEDQIREHVYYCDMVANKAWPDYNNIYDQCDKAYNALKELENN